MLLKVRGVNASYGVIPVLHGVSLDIGEGELVALLGGNGSGKTTLLNAISGLVRCSAGTIEFSGRRVDGLEPHKVVEAGIAQIPEGRQLFPYLTVKENLFMGACTPRAWPHRHTSFERVCALFPRLRERSGQRAGSLSGGEQQMLAIGRGLMALPKLLMVDEPSLGLAPAVLSQIYSVLRILPKEGITVLLSEQNAQVALEVADRGYVLQDGSIVLQDASSELLDSDLIKKAYLGV